MKSERKARVEAAFDSDVFVDKPVLGDVDLFPGAVLLLKGQRDLSQNGLWLFETAELPLIRLQICERCGGVGVTTWDAFVAGLANIIGAIVGQQVRGRCSTCAGTGFQGGRRPVERQS